MRSGIKILSDVTGTGPEIARQRVYLVRLKLWLNRGEPVKWQAPWGLVDRARLEDNGETLVSDLRIDREHLISGLFHGVQGMRIGGTRKLKISPHLAYGKRGIPGLIPEDAVIIAELSVLEERRIGGSLTELLFAYGTLQSENVQVATFGRKLVGTADALAKYDLVPLDIDDERVVAVSGLARHTMARFTGRDSDVVPGTVFALTPDELEIADDYEVPAVTRIAVVLESGAHAWVYVDARCAAPAP